MLKLGIGLYGYISTKDQHRYVLKEYNKHVFCGIMARGGGRLHIKLARMCVLRIEKYTHFEGLLKN